MKDIRIVPVSVIRRDGLQRVDIFATTQAPGKYFLSIWKQDACYARDIPFGLNSGSSFATVWVEPPEADFAARWVITDRKGNELAEICQTYSPPRKWTIYTMISSHLDIGLHRSPYIQRQESARFFDEAKKLSRQTADRPEESQYRYVFEGTWAWNNYCQTYGKAEAADTVKMIRDGKLGVCACVAGNHIHSYGMEELCRSTYSRRWLEEQGIPCKTMTMIDVPGLPWSMVQPYADAGIENIIFAPNNWGPHLSQTWTLDAGKIWVMNNPESCGGGSRIDVRYESALPMLFYWQGQSDRKMLVWASAQYGVGGERFGISAFGGSVEGIYACMGQHLPLMEQKYPYDIWLVENYEDNMAPELRFTDTITQWNAQFAWPQIRTLGNPDEPFDLVRQRFGDQIPTLRGDITNGWALHTLAAADVLSQSLNADRKLPTAEKLATLASLYAGTPYPAADFNRAWSYLIMNDEHSYGVGEYYGRDVAETWMQHRDWVQKATQIAQHHTDAAMDALASRIPGKGKRLVIFNPTAQPRRERIVLEGQCIADIPAFGYAVLPMDRLEPVVTEETTTKTPPVIENTYYRIVFAENGTLQEIYDKELGRVINAGNCNELLYTRDNCRSFHRPTEAKFTVCRDQFAITVKVQTFEPTLGAKLVQTVTLPNAEKRIDLDNQVLHASDMIVSDRKDRSRYDRALYFAFPFQVENCRRYCDLGGVEAEYGVDLTGHCSDTYMTAHEYCCAENGEFGVGLIQQDSQIVEFDHIHPDKTDFGDPGAGAAMYSFVATSWVHHKQLPGGKSIHYRFRYTITSYGGDHGQAGLAKLAERIVHPVIIRKVQEQRNGALPEHQMSFIETDARLVCLKRARDGKGIVARLYSDPNWGAMQLRSFLPGYTRWEPVSIDENPAQAPIAAGFATFRSSEGMALKPARLAAEDPLVIGARETGLINRPRAASAYDSDPPAMYLLWGECTHPELSHYEVFRDVDPHFVPYAHNRIATVQPEGYVVARYVDLQIRPNTVYWYRVRAILRDGQAGPFSEPFSGLSRE